MLYCNTYLTGLVWSLLKIKKSNTKSLVFNVSLKILKDLQNDFSGWVKSLRIRIKQKSIKFNPNDWSKLIKNLIDKTKHSKNTNELNKKLKIVFVQQKT